MLNDISIQRERLRTNQLGMGILKRTAYMYIAYMQNVYKSSEYILNT